MLKFSHTTAPLLARDCHTPVTDVCICGKYSRDMISTALPQPLTLIKYTLLYIRARVESCTVGIRNRMEKRTLEPNSLSYLSF